MPSTGIVDEGWFNQRRPGLPVGGYLAMLAAFLTASATLCPFATAAALRLTVR